jgi:hypothetical protein
MAFLSKTKIATTILVVVVLFATYFIATVMQKQTHFLRDIWTNGEANTNTDSQFQIAKTTRRKKASTQIEPITQLRDTSKATSSPRSAKIKTSSASPSEFAWKTLSRTLKIYSSYYDRRPLKTMVGVFSQSLAIFGYEYGIIAGNLFCVVIMANNRRTLVEVPAVRESVAELWKNRTRAYRAFVYRCKLRTPEIPRYVTLTKATTTIGDIALTSFIPVVDPYLAKARHKFGVCYGSPMRGFKYDQDIMDSIEMNRLLGATWFTIYVYEAHDKAMKILKYYSQELKILNAVLNWGENLPIPSYTFGQLVALQDCIYRNMYLVKFLVLCDVDELIFPQKGLNWNELLSKINRPKRAHFTFAHLGYHNEQIKASEYLCPGKSNLTYKLPRYFTMYKTSVSPLRIPKQAKSIAKPKFVITSSVHNGRRLLPGYERYYVPQNLAVMKHFRSEPSKWDKYDNTTSDYTMDRFKPALLAAIEKHFCEKVNW